MSPSKTRGGSEGAAPVLPITSAVGIRQAYPAACPDCPGPRLELLESLVGATRSECLLETGSVAARAPLPAAWSTRYEFGIVRRGVIIRQRLDASGRATAVDAAGAGCLLPLRSAGRAVAGYAAIDSMVCLCPTSTAKRTLVKDTRLGADLLQLQSDALERIERIAHARGRPSARARVAALLCALADCLSPPRQRECLPAGLQQRDLAALVGVRHETLCRVLGTLERSGGIERHPDGLRLLDRGAIEVT